MTFARFREYVMTVLGGMTLANVFIGIGLLGMLSGRPDLISNPAVAIPLLSVGGLLGWWLVYRSPPPVVTTCPTCHQTVVAHPEFKPGDQPPREPVI